MFLYFFGALLALPISLVASGEPAKDNCKPIFVRWPRVKLNVPARLNGPFSISSCQNACAVDENPHKRAVPQQCSAFNHRVGPSDYTNECHIFEEHSVRKIDGLVEADDRYSFYWKYCLNTNKTCLGDYGFTFLSDRFINSAQVKRVSNSNSLENCLTECLNEEKFHCRSVAYNRTSGYCALSEYNQLSKPAMIKINNNPNYRIDYYENNCFKIADTFHFDYKCEADGFRVKVKSQYPYTGALYGLYDFFSCRIEPQESSNFEYLFPYPDMSRNCTDSIRYKGNEMILEVVLSTDGVEPLYFITADDLTYQARCPIDPKLREKQNSLTTNQFTTTTTHLPENENKIELASDSHKESSFLAKSQKIRMDGSWNSDDLSSTATSRKYRAMEAITIPYDSKSTTKDIFPLPLFTTTVPTPFGQQSTTSPNFDQPHLNSQFGGLEALTIGTKSSTTSTTTTEVPSTTTQKLKTTTKKSLEIINRNANQNPDSFNFSTRITFPKGDKINVNMGPPRDEDHKAASSHDLNSYTSTPVITTTTSIPTTTKSTTTQKSTSTSTTQVPTTTTTTPAPFTLFPPLTFPTFPTILPPIAMPTIALEPVTTSTSTSTAASTTQSTSKEPSSPSPRKTQSKNETIGQAPGSRKQNDAIIFDIYHNSMPAEAVVVGSRITLSFTPYFAVPPSYMSISGCQVEPISPLYDWEKEPLAIIKDGCQADHVGLVCPPQRTDYGIRVTVESFRYQTTTQLQYTCLIRICPFAPCPQTTCSSVEGCSGDDLVSRTLGLRAKRELSLEQIRAALAANPYLQQQLALSTSPSNAQMSNSLQQQLIAIGGDHLVRKRLVVVNTDEELHYYVKTGELPEHHG